MALPGNAARFLLKRLDKTQFKQRLFAFLQDAPPGAVEAFWDENMGRVKPWYRQVKRPDDLIISASPEFLLRPACARLDLSPPIASRVDPATGRYQGRNCDGAEKARRYLASGLPPIDCFYSDSLGDAPMARLAQRAFLVRGDRIRPWPGL